MKTRIALAVALLAVYAGSLRLTGQGLQGGPSAARNWAQDAPMMIIEPFTLANAVT
jgi:hypothetical protein